METAVVKNLRIVYGDTVLWDGPVSKITWGETDDVVEVRAEAPKEPRPTIGDLIARRLAPADAKTEPA